MGALRFLAVVLALMVAAMVMGCEQKGPAEKAGEKVGEAAEKTGEAVDESYDRAKDSLKKLQDSLEKENDR